MSPEYKELILSLRFLADNWDKNAAAARKLADKEDTSPYTKGYGYGSAETLELNAATLRSLLDSEK